MKNMFEIIKRSLVSEKGTQQTEAFNTYIFEVSSSANKQEIRQAIEKIFKVKVNRVNTMIMHGKYRRAGKFTSKQTNWKKALVTLKEGQKIELAQGV